MALPMEGQAPERTCRYPARAQLLVAVASKAADVGADHGHAEHVEGQDAANGELQGLPRGNVVSGPVRHGCA
jgi:hypothetical protein